MINYPAHIRQQSVVLLREMSGLLRSLADQIDDAIKPDNGVDAGVLMQVANDLKLNHKTLVTLHDVTTKLGHITPKLN